MKNLNTNTKISLATAFFLVSFLTRTVWHIAPNVEFLTAALILSSFLFGKKISFVGTFLVLIFSDIIIGNTSILLFTWSGFLLPALLTPGIARLMNKKLKRFGLVITGIGANLFFYIWTNFGVWALDSWGMYEKTTSGLVRCYINALPFLRNQMVSTLIGVIVFSLVITVASKVVEIRKVKLATA